MNMHHMHHVYELRYIYIILQYKIMYMTVSNALERPGFCWELRGELVRIEEVLDLRPLRCLRGRIATGWITLVKKSGRRFAVRADGEDPKEVNSEASGHSGSEAGEDLGCLDSREHFIANSQGGKAMHASYGALTSPGLSLKELSEPIRLLACSLFHGRCRTEVRIEIVDLQRRADHQ